MKHEPAKSEVLRDQNSSLATCEFEQVPVIQPDPAEITNKRDVRHTRERAPGDLEMNALVEQRRNHAAMNPSDRIYSAA